MRSLGLWPTSPLARLEETLVTVRDLLRGAECDLVGAQVSARRVRLHTAPVNVPILAGVRGPRSLEVAGRASDGVGLAGFAGPAYVASAREIREILEWHRLCPARIVASARFALDGADPTTSAAQRIHRDLIGNLDALRSMLPRRFGTDPAVDAELLHAEPRGRERRPIALGHVIDGLAFCDGVLEVVRQLCCALPSEGGGNAGPTSTTKAVSGTCRAVARLTPDAVANRRQVADGSQNRHP